MNRPRAAAILCGASLALCCLPARADAVLWNDRPSPPHPTDVDAASRLMASHGERLFVSLRAPSGSVAFYAIDGGPADPASHPLLAASSEALSRSAGAPADGSAAKSGPIMVTRHGLTLAVDPASALLRTVPESDRFDGTPRMDPQQAARLASEASARIGLTPAPAPTPDSAEPATGEPKEAADPAEASPPAPGPAPHAESAERVRGESVEYARRAAEAARSAPAQGAFVPNPAAGADEPRPALPGLARPPAKSDSADDAPRPHSPLPIIGR